MDIKTISSNYVVQRLLANHTINNSNWINDSKDWVAQAMRFIGKHVGFPVKICEDVLVQDYHTCYPHDMEGILAVMYKGNLLPLGSDISGIGYTRQLNKQVTDSIGYSNTLELNKLEAQKEALIKQYAEHPTSDIEEEINRIAAKVNKLTKFISASVQLTSQSRKTRGEFYNTKTQVLQTSFAEGYIDIIYVAFPLDDDGFPLILDDEYYIQAVEWYILLILMQKGYQHPIFKYQEVYNMFFGSRKTGEIGWKDMAANHARIPSIQETERLARMWEQFKFRRELPIQLFNKTEQSFGLVY